MTFLIFGGAFASGTQTIYAKALDDHGCNTNEWHFVIVQINEEANAPSMIHVEWSNGASEDVSRGNFTGGVAHYTTYSNLGSSVVSASATIYSEWSGEFNLSHGPCNPPTEPTPTPPTEPTPTPGPRITPTPDWPLCWPRKEVVITGCPPSDLKVSQWINFDPLSQEPTGEKLSDRPWSGEMLLYDLEYETTYGWWGWSEGTGWIWLFSDITGREKAWWLPCDILHNEYHFQCPAPTPPPVPELPETGYTPQVKSPLLAIAALAVGVLFIGGARILSLRRRQ